MTAYWNNKRRITFRIVFIIFCSLFFALCYLLYPDKADSGPYLESAHGDADIGVLRTSLSPPPINYGRGNCAHCHEQHSSIGGAEPAPNSPAGPDFYLLFDDLWKAPIQSNVFCYQCHGGSYQSGLLQNYSYSYRRGGDTCLCPSSVFESFQFIQNSGASQPNCGAFACSSSSVGSAHRFGDFAPIAGFWGFSSNINEVNPCSTCHNPHKAKKEFPCSKPSAHTNKYAWDVWGDDSIEKMNIYASNNYWAPKRVGGGYEPNGSLIQDGSNMPDYVSLCIDCHNSSRLIYSTRLSRNLYRVNWSAAGDFHGGRQRIDDGGDFSQVGEYGDLIEPYKDQVSGSYPRLNYVLSCTDCHEPHGSPNEFLLRKTVNGTQVPTISGNGLWYDWCQTCHSVNLPLTPSQHLPPIYSTTNCFNAGACHRHCDGVACSSNNLF